MKNGRLVNYLINEYKESVISTIKMFGIITICTFAFFMILGVGLVLSVGPENVPLTEGKVNWVPAVLVVAASTSLFIVGLCALCVLLITISCGLKFLRYAIVSRGKPIEFMKRAEEFDYRADMIEKWKEQFIHSKEAEWREHLAKKIKEAQWEDRPI